MAVKLFVTGATGYIGGDFLFVAVKAHPEWDITCLVRDPSKGSTLTKTYPNFHVVHGDLDSTSTIEEEASKADIVYHFANSDHMKSAKAISRGLARNKNTTAFWIQTSGAGILTHENFTRNSYGYPLESDKKVYDDWENIHELTSLPDRAIHRHVDKVVLSASSGNPGHVKTAVVAPSCIYGLGRGTGNTLSVQVYVAAEVALTSGKGRKVGSGNNIWHEVHIHDLTDLYVLLGEAAAAGGGQATWNERGYYLAENGDFIWGDIMHRIAKEAWKQGFLPSADVESVEAEEAKTLHRFFPHLCGTTSRGVSVRARELLGWKPTRKGMIDDVAEIVQQQASRLNLKPKRGPRSSL